MTLLNFGKNDLLMDNVSFHHVYLRITKAIRYEYLNVSCVNLLSQRDRIRGLSDVNQIPIFYCYFFVSLVSKISNTNKNFFNFLMRDCKVL